MNYTVFSIIENTVHVLLYALGAGICVLTAPLFVSGVLGRAMR